VQDLLRRLPRLNISPASIQGSAIAALCVVLILAVTLVLVMGGGKKEGAASVTALKPSSAVTEDLTVTYAAPGTAPQKPDTALQKPSAAPSKPTEAMAKPLPREDAIRVMSWDLSSLPAMAGGRSADAGNTPWRTSFGSERVTPPEIRYDLKADIVLLQGISDATRLRRFFFPARDWHLIVTRQKLTDVAMRADPASASSGITGVAIRVRDDLRITGREFFPRIGGEQDGDGAAMLAGTAVRVLDRGRSVWLASFAVPPACAETPAPCKARTHLTEWQESKRQNGEVIVIGGMLAAPEAKPGTEGDHCDRQRLKSDIESYNLPIMTADNLAGPGSGCALAMDLSK
jgi:hypothetical protein